MVQITNGKINYGRTIKTGDFESKRGDVELSFSIPEDESHDIAVRHVHFVAKKHLHEILGHPEDKVVLGVAEAPAKPSAKAEKPKTAAKIPATVAKTDDAASVEEPGEKTPAFLGKKDEAIEDSIDDLLGIDVAAKDITDKELTDATQKCQSQHKNPTAIRKILTDLGIKMPPGRVIDLPQAKRQEYLDKLLEVKPLA